MRFSGACVAGLAALLVSWPADAGRAGATDSPAPNIADSLRQDRTWEHRYRIGGKVRMLLFWVGDDDVGGARMWMSSYAGTRTISFLGGSDPTRAPRKLNMWGYAFEESRGDAARVFMLRSMRDADATVDEWRLADGGAEALFGATCTAFERAESRASITGVRVEPTVTYHGFSEVLDAVGASSRWRTERGERPAGVHPGFFTALQEVIADSVAGAHVGMPLPRNTMRLYVYKGLLFELRIQKVEAAGPGLLRGRYQYRNRSTGESGDFSVTYGTEGDLATVPVVMAVQPNWWLRLELRLDDRVDVPADPAHDAFLARHMSEICARALTSNMPSPTAH